MASEDFVPAALRRLWRMSEPSRLGRRPALDIDRVVTTAVEIADRDGLGGVTLPKVAQALGFTGMSLYRHVGSKDELLVLMADHALGPPPEPAGEDWRDGLRDWAFGQRAIFRRRPWLVQVPASGPPSGPNQVAWMEAALVVLARTGLDWPHKLGVLSLVGGYVIHSARQDGEFTAARAEGQEQAEAARDWAVALARLVQGGRFPETARLFSSTLFSAPPVVAGVDMADADFSLGLDVILDGVAARIART